MQQRNYLNGNFQRFTYLSYENNIAGSSNLDGQALILHESVVVAYLRFYIVRLMLNLREIYFDNSTGLGFSNT